MLLLVYPFVFLVSNGPVIMAGLRMKNLRLIKITTIFFMYFCFDRFLKAKDRQMSRAESCSLTLLVARALFVREDRHMSRAESRLNVC